MRPFEKFSRKPRRLVGYDYRSEGLYFVTICTQDRWPYFGEVTQGEMILSDEGIIARDYWLEIPLHHSFPFLGEFVVMPNHVHGIIGIEHLPAEGGAGRPVAAMHRIAGPPPATDANLGEIPETEPSPHISALSPKAKSLSRIIGSYKSACTKMIHSVSTEPFAWQARFHDRIIRNQQELERVEAYILSNTERWAEDEFYCREENG
jgi:putative transposase